MSLKNYLLLTTLAGALYFGCDKNDKNELRPLAGTAQISGLYYPGEQEESEERMEEKRQKDFFFDKATTQLVKRLRRDGHDISPYLKDSRFRFYNDIKTLKRRDEGKFNEEAHKRNLENYVKKHFFDSFNFLLMNEKKLWEATLEYRGATPAYIVSILNRESKLGEHTGSKIVFNTLVTVYRDFPKKRHKGFNAYAQLKALIKLAEGQDEDLFSYKGSYMGAMGLMQSIPTNIPVFGVDFNRDGRIDIYDKDDAIGFIAKYTGHFSKGNFLKNKRSAILAYNHSRVYYNYIVVLAEALDSAYKIYRDKKWKELFINNYETMSAESDKTKTISTL